MVGLDRTVLIGDDEAEVRDYLQVALKCSGYAAETAEDGAEVLQCLSSSARSYAAVLLDITMPHKDGFETLRDIRRIYGDLPVIMMSGQASPSRVMEAVRYGASDFLGKPISHEDLESALRKHIAGRTAAAIESPAPKISAAKSGVFSGGFRSQELQKMVGRVGASDVPVLIQGETGSGKEVFARQLHAASTRSGKPFLKLNCAALPSELIESELFGYERGAFTGAFQRKLGMFELADGGTIFLDEIGDMDVKLQAKFLQVLQDHEFQRLGGKETVRVNVRVMAATHRDLERAIEDGRFREDLYYRLNVITMQIPALRERRDEIVALAEYLLQKHAKPGTPMIPVLTPALKQKLLEHDWPGNVRELENVMRSFLVFREPEAVIRNLEATRRRECLAAAAGAGAQSAGSSAGADQPFMPVLQEVSRAKDEAESELILGALNATRWNRKKAATLLQLDYKALLYKMKKLAIEDKA